MRVKLLFNYCNFDSKHWANKKPTPPTHLNALKLMNIVYCAKTGLQNEKMKIRQTFRWDERHRHNSNNDDDANDDGRSYMLCTHPQS